VSLCIDDAIRLLCAVHRFNVESCSLDVIHRGFVCAVHRFNVESCSLDVIHRGFSCSAALSKRFKVPRPHTEPQNWPLYNDVVYPPSLPNEPLRPAVSEV